MAAIGGQGGGPNNDWIGVKGQQRFIRLDLKLLADVGLVGFPIEGQSQDRELPFHDDQT